MSQTADPTRLRRHVEYLAASGDTLDYERIAAVADAVAHLVIETVAEPHTAAAGERP